MGHWSRVCLQMQRGCWELLCVENEREERHKPTEEIAKRSFKLECLCVHANISMFIYAFTLKAHFPVHGQEGCRSVCVCNKPREPQEPTSEGSLRVKGPWLDTHTHFCLFVSSADFGSTLQ